MKTLLVISIAKPILVGIYENDILIQTISQDGMTSDILPIIVKDILQEHKLDEIVYVNGPGSYMAIKIAYIFLKTITITNNITLKAIDGFSVNNNMPIKALGKKYFIKKGEKILIDSIDDTNSMNSFFLPQNLSLIYFQNETLPEYHLPAV